MKLFLPILFSLFVSASYAAELFVPLSQFDNDSQQLSDSRVLESWVYHNYDNNDNYQNILKLRYYNPLEAGDWRGRIRLDTSYTSNYNSISSVDNAGQYSAGSTMVIIWGQDRTFLKPLAALVGGRVISPFGNNGQWAVGPQLNWAFVTKVDNLLRVTDISPLVRYMYGFDTKK
uniref:Uncharacterized protein n=1 Tax=Polynucleobacter necessarius subsp. necessarius (strain STIR1) TaxID=452638 RepID=B1XVX6_POLNS